MSTPEPVQMTADSPHLVSWLAHLEWADRTRPRPAGVCPVDAVRSLEFVPPGCTAEDWLVPGPDVAEGVLRLIIAPGGTSVHVIGLSAFGDRASDVHRVLVDHGRKRAADLGASLNGTHEVAIAEDLADLEQHVAELPEGLTWAEKAPFGIRQVLDLAGTPHTDVSLPAGYELVTWGTTTPETYMRACARLERTMGGEAYDEPETVEETHSFGVERMRKGRGRHAHHTGVLDSASGELVGFSSISVTAAVADHAYQGMTVVEPSHRGRGLATALKRANLNQLRAAEPVMRSIETANDHSNTAMLALNQACGFRPISCLIPWTAEGTT